jgi:hypothetical protein
MRLHASYSKAFRLQPPFLAMNGCMLLQCNGLQQCRLHLLPLLRPTWLAFGTFTGVNSTCICYIHHRGAPSHLGTLE